MGFHDIASKIGGRNDECGNRAEAEEKQRTMKTSVVLESEMGKGAEIEKMAEDRKLWWRWR